MISSAVKRTTTRRSTGWQDAFNGKQGSVLLEMGCRAKNSRAMSSLSSTTLFTNTNTVDCSSRNSRSNPRSSSGIGRRNQLFSRKRPLKSTIEHQARAFPFSTSNGNGIEKDGDARVLAKLAAKTEELIAWEKELEPGMKLVENTVEEAIMELEKHREEVPKWKTAFRAVRDIALSPKKHLFRPQLVFLGYAAGSGEKDLIQSQKPPQGLVDFAAGVELQHLFMFVHDDLMDNALTRRGHDTIQVAIQRSEREESSQEGKLRKPGDSVSRDTVQHLTTLVGDVLQAKSAQLLINGEKKIMKGKATGSGTGSATSNATDVIFEGAFRAAAAQFDDILGWEGVERAVKMDEEKSPSCNDAQTNLLVRLLSDKASFHSFAAPLIAGIRLGKPIGSDTKDLENACTAWATHTGAAFQGIDDVMDLVLEVQDSGKDRLQDIQEGRLSLPLFLLRQQATSEEWSQVYEILGSRSVLAPSERHLLLNLISKYELNKAALEFVEQEIQQARVAIQASSFQSSDSQDLFDRGLGIYIDGLVHLTNSLKQQV